MTSTFRGTFVLLSSVLLVTAAAAESTGPQDNIVVTATRSPISVDDAIVPVTVITRQDIENAMPADLAELLRFEAGIDIGRHGGPGQAASIFLRGTESNHTLVLVDGVRINPGTVGGAAIQNIAPGMIERIEIVKGARSSLFGTDAIGGVVNIITRRSDREFVDGSVGGGSFDTRAASFAAGRRGASGELGAAFSWQDTDGFPARSDSDIDRGYENLSANLYAGRTFGAHKLSLRHWRAAGTVEYFDFLLAPLDQDYRNESSALEIESALADGLDSKLVLSRIVDDIEQNQSEDFVVSTRHAMDWQLGLTRGEHHWIGGIYLVEEDAEALSFGSSFDETTRVRAVFVEDYWTRGRNSLFAAVRFTDHETFGSHTAWNLEYARELGERWTLNAGIGHAFRAPDATDRYGFGGSTELEPEVADEIQLGLEYRPSARQSLELSLYRNDIEDLIEFDIVRLELRNIAVAEVRGAELSWEYQGDSWRARTTLVRQSAEDATTGARLFRRAERSATLRLDRELGAHRLGLSLLATGDREDVGDQHMAGYVLVNLNGQLALGERWRLDARLENALDTAYETAAGFRMQERSVFVDLRYAWR